MRPRQTCGQSRSGQPLGIATLHAAEEMLSVFVGLKPECQGIVCVCLHFVVLRLVLPGRRHLPSYLKKAISQSYFFSSAVLPECLTHR